MTDELAVRGYAESGKAKAERLDRVLAKLLPQVSRAELQRWIREERVWLNGAPSSASSVLRTGDVVEVEPAPPQLSAAEPDASVEFQVVYEDEQLLVIDKPAGLVVHPGAGHHSGTLVNGLLARPGFEVLPVDPRDPEGFRRPGIVHRLDKDTSGLLVVARDATTREALKEQFEAHSIDREYLALTLGEPKEGRIETFHGRHPVHRQRFTSLLPKGRRAVTSFHINERLGIAALVSCRLETGRTHQIRVHLSEQCKTPILGDPLYGRRSQDPRLTKIAEGLGRQALHATELGFVHPATGEHKLFRSPAPADFASALDALREF
ncbi:MAG: RluA family pseudouridine synthase [Polyangiaceae bacterium]|nr:RluA family pseudouridine synthase [Myxococcales bacterium]MCB9591016.1 RluA family pseudouridine synthase [Polyangiaceae bacterium]MCB9605179.1 RluA family pseudouridine synthase [Polyangiaceae bacterium]